MNHVLFLSHIIVWLTPTLAVLSLESSSTSTECFISGKSYEVGQVIDDLDSRCGSATKFPCFCDPTQNPPISCPYCSFALPNGGLLCMFEDDTKEFTGVDNKLHTCTCILDDNDRPVPNCDSRPGLAASQTSTMIQQQQSDSCTIDLPDGGSKTFSRGESIGDMLPNRCGDDFPCYCNPDAPGQIECPYCRFPIQGGDLLCAGDGETVSFVDLDGIQQSCSCDAPNNYPTVDPISDCNIDGNSDKNESIADGGSNGNGVCTLELESGQILTFDSGESFGDYVETRCGSSFDFPCYCNPDLPNQMECPYCGFVQANGDLLCAGHQEIVSFFDGVSDQTCTCEIPIDPLEEPTQECVEGSVPTPTASPPGGGDNNGQDDNKEDDDVVVDDEEDDDEADDEADNDDNNNSNSNEETTGCTILDENGGTVTIPDGSTFGNLVEGVCGDSSQWPSFCNTQVEGSVVSRTGSQDFDSIEYPYCVYSDTMSGETTCARNNEEIEYTDSSGIELRCFCSFAQSGLGGAQSTCSPLNGSDPPNTQPADPAATTQSSNAVDKPTSLMGLLLLVMLIKI